MGLFSVKSPSPASGRVSIARLQGLGARDNQQDSFAVAGSDCAEKGMLAIVADGMGGLVNSGQISSAVTKVMSEAYTPDPAQSGRDQLLSLTGKAIAEAESLTKDLTYQSGTTLIACILRKGGLSWMSIGDSRLCLYRGGSLIQLNRDHDFAHDLLLMTLRGQITMEQALHNPRREALTSHIGSEFPRYFDFNQEPVRLMQGDRVILMSDGVYRSLTQEELCQSLEKGADKSAELIRKRIEAKALPQQDNFTAIILEIL